MFGDLRVICLLLCYLKSEREEILGLHHDSSSKGGSDRDVRVEFLNCLDLLIDLERDDGCSVLRDSDHSSDIICLRIRFLYRARLSRVLGFSFRLMGRTASFYLSYLFPVLCEEGNPFRVECDVDNLN